MSLLRSLRWSVRSWPVRTQARVGVCLLIAALSIGVAQMWVMRSSAQLRDEAGATLLQTARDMAEVLSREMAGRARDVQLLSQIDLFRDASDAPAMRDALKRLRATLPAYAWIGVTDAEGNVVADRKSVV